MEGEERSFFELLVEATPRFVVTPALTIANVVWFLVMVLSGVSVISPQPQELLVFGANFGPLTMGGEWWRLASSTFVHIGILHIAFNMWCLWSLGNIAERMFGNATFAAIYLLSGLGGSLASLFWHPDIISAGASGAVFGIAGALVAFLYLGHILVPRAAVRELLMSLLFFVGFNLIFGFVHEGIDNAGHLGGLAMGAVLGAVLHRPIPARPRSPARYGVVPVAAAVLVLGAFIAREVNEKNPRMLVAAAARLYSESDRQTAIATLERAIAVDPEMAEAHWKLGLVYLEAERLEEAVRSLEHAARISEDSAPLRLDLGRAYLSSQRYPEAISAFRTAGELDPQLYAAQRNLAIALTMAGEDDEAVEALRTARSMEPSDVSIYVILGSLLADSGRAGEAIEALEEALTWKPDSAEVHSAMGLARLRNEEPELAVGALRKAIELAPDNAEHKNRLGLALAIAGENDEALQTIEAALELAPDAPHILDSLGTVRLYRGEIDHAIDAYERAIALDPTQAVYHANLSLALRRAGALDRADAALEEARRLDPELDLPADGRPIV